MVEQVKNLKVVGRLQALHPINRYKTDCKASDVLQALGMAGFIHK